VTRITGTLHEVRCTVLIITPAVVVVGMRNVSDKSCRESQNTNFMLNNFTKIMPFFKLCEKNVVEPSRPQTTI
jgi:hypothetical protein